MATNFQTGRRRGLWRWPMGGQRNGRLRHAGQLRHNLFCSIPQRPHGLGHLSAWRFDHKAYHIPFDVQGAHQIMLQQAAPIRQCDAGQSRFDLILGD